MSPGRASSTKCILPSMWAMPCPSFVNLVMAMLLCSIGVFKGAIDEGLFYYLFAKLT